MHQNFGGLVSLYAKRLRHLRLLGLGQVFYRNKFLRKDPLALGSDSGQGGEGGNDVFLCPKALVSAGGKAVGFVAHALQKPKGVAALGKRYRR